MAGSIADFFVGKVKTGIFFVGVVGLLACPKAAAQGDWPYPDLRKLQSSTVSSYGLPLDDDSALQGMGPTSGGIRSKHTTETPGRGDVPEGRDPHIDLFMENMYPSALTCAKCHPKIYEEWQLLPRLCRDLADVS